MADFKKLSENYFKRFPNNSECHITADGRVFHTKGNADSFANGLKDKKVTSFKRGAEATAEKADKAIINKTDAEAKLLATDLATASYEDLKALATALEVKPEGNKKENYISTLEAVKSKIKAV